LPRPRLRLHEGLRRHHAAGRERAAPRGRARRHPALDRAGSPEQLIGRLSGRVADESADGTIVLDVQGVGYEVALPIGSLGRLLASAGPKHAGPPEITIFVHTHVREDALSLFGFATREDRAAFRALIGVSNIGPKTAMAVLGALPGPELSMTV